MITSLLWLVKNSHCKWKESKYTVCEEQPDIYKKDRTDEIGA